MIVNLQKISPYSHSHYGIVGLKNKLYFSMSSEIQLQKKEISFFPGVTSLFPQSFVLPKQNCQTLKKNLILSRISDKNCTENGGLLVLFLDLDSSKY